jgi:integrase
LVPALRDELAAHKAHQSRGGRQADLVFGTETGGKQNPSNVRTRVLARAVKRANERRAQVNRHPLPERLTPHSLRKTFISVLFALGEDVPYVMAQVGHRDPKVTLGIYAEVMRRDEGEKDRLRALVGGDEKARMGATGSGPSSIRAIAEPIQAKETA